MCQHRQIYTLLQSESTDMSTLSTEMHFQKNKLRFLLDSVHLHRWKRIYRQLLLILKKIENDDAGW